MKVTNVTSHPVDLDDGRLLAPGETGEAKPSDRTAGLIESGQLVERSDPPKTKAAQPGGEKKGD